MSGEHIRIYVPPGWPEQVRPPGAPRWEKTALMYLLDLCPANYRLYDVVAHEPRIAVHFARIYVEQRLKACDDGLTQVRSALTGVVTPTQLQGAIAAWQTEAAQLVRDRRGVLLVGEALAGRPFVAKLPPVGS